MRLFIALDLPDPAIRQLRDLQDPDLDVRWTSSDTMHLTLRFIGDAGKDLKNRLVDRLSEVVHRPFRMEVNGLGYFPPRKQPKILWAGIAENEELMKLQEKIEEACRDCGVEPEQRPYTPHVTIGRARGASKRDLLAFIREHSSLWIGGIPVEEFVLYESRLQPEGAKHSPLEHFSLLEEPEPGT